jgi:class 3 adenylate cyclase
VTTPLWALYPIMGCVSLLLFDARIALGGFATSVAVLYGLAVAERLGWVPYAPVFATWPEVDGRIADGWLWSNMIWPAAVISATFAMFAVVLRRSQWQAAQLRRTAELLKRLFGRYVSADVMRTLLEDPEAFDGIGDRREVTILMSDLRGFTALAERTPPEHVLSALNEYLGVVIEICFQHGGTVNEILGDAVMVIFGAPLPLEGHARAAVACAIEMQNAMNAVNRRNAVTGFPRLEMGIGINTATVIVGNIGSARRASASSGAASTCEPDRVVRRGWAGAPRSRSSIGCPAASASTGGTKSCRRARAVRSPCTRSAASSAIARSRSRPRISHSVRRHAGCASATASSRASTSASARTTRPSSGCPRRAWSSRRAGPSASSTRCSSTSST